MKSTFPVKEASGAEIHTPAVDAPRPVVGQDRRRAGVIADPDGECCEGPSLRDPGALRDPVALRVLVVDDEFAQRRILEEILQAAGYQVTGAGSLTEALGRIEESGADLVLTDLKMPGGTGMELLEEIKKRGPETEVVIMTAFSSVETAVEAMRKGAHNYLPKPFTKEDLLAVVGQLRERVQLRSENRQLRRSMTERFGYHNMLSRSPQMREVFDTLEKVHSNSATVLVRGESGTGKELVARAIHVSGRRRTRPFVAINCAAIPEMLIESELFGHEKGAFTGAVSAKIGRFEEVEDGTLFLDEIGSMRYDLQAKLLRVIQEREFQRIGGCETLRFRGRIVAATGHDLEALMRANRFREDLYFRLNVVPVELPPLRERTGDVPLLAMHFLRKYAVELDKDLESLAPGVLDALEAHSWPGNVRELENVIQRAVVLSDEGEKTLGPERLPDALQRQIPPRRRFTNGASGSILGTEEIENKASRGGAADRRALVGGIDGTESGNGTEPDPNTPRREPQRGWHLPPEGVCLGDVESELIRQALVMREGRLEPAARLLGITYKTLQYRIKKHGLQSFQRPRSGADGQSTHETTHETTHENDLSPDDPRETVTTRDSETASREQSGLRVDPHPKRYTR
ncbi:MAG: sigma-54 dependent transcriptional regulator [Planctomycetota bacterium]|nr:sigma-54 dependent transcriptional regulator [Planctomycetota bacterium]